MMPSIAPADVGNIIAAVATQFASNHLKVDIQLNVDALQQPSSVTECAGAQQQAGTTCT
jgi:hypothetical protein